MRRLVTLALALQMGQICPQADRDRIVLDNLASSIAKHQSEINDMKSRLDLIETRQEQMVQPMQFCFIDEDDILDDPKGILKITEICTEVPTVTEEYEDDDYELLEKQEEAFIKTKA